MMFLLYIAFVAKKKNKKSERCHVRKKKVIRNGKGSIFEGMKIVVTTVSEHNGSGNENLELVMPRYLFPFVNF